MVRRDWNRVGTRCGDRRGDTFRSSPPGETLNLDVRPTRDQTLLEREGDSGAVTTGERHLVKAVRRLRELPIRDYRVEDLRVMIGEGMGLFIPLTIALDGALLD